jgi:hypothetical protein
VVETSLSVLICGMGRVDSLRICLVGMHGQGSGHERGALVGSWTANTFGETLLGTCELEGAIEKPCCDRLVIHHRKCIHDKIEIFVVITECVQSLQNVKLF